MEEQALYRAILRAPHDDATRLVYADWLDEFADACAGPLAQAERGRAEFIRLQCAIARSTPAGWRAGPRVPTADQAKRERRLIFQHAQKWRRAFPVVVASASFDRGFLRPFRSFTPQQFLRHPLTGTFPPLPDDSPASRYVPSEDGPFAACPLWDVHLYAPGWLNDPLSDRGQYGEMLAEVAQSPALERVGWLKVSFFQTPVLDFLRTGNFANVETLVLNSGPFPEVLEAVTENESFRSLRYVQFGDDRWAWASGYPAMLQFLALADRLRTANDRHVPFGEMRAVLRGILRDTPVVPVAPPPAPVPAPRPFPALQWTPAPTTPPENRWSLIGVLFGMMFLALWFIVGTSNTKRATNSPPTYPAFQPVRPIDLSGYKMPNSEPDRPGPGLKTYAEYFAEWEAFKKKYNVEQWPVPPSGPRPKPPVAPPPREVKRPADSGEK